MAANLVTGSVVTETVFVWPGMGRLLVSSIESRDFPVAQACILTLAVIYILINMLIDTAYAFLNPRLRAL
jgi:peptide/nickel transport system permease protein